ncbi:MAG: site-specific DNA-methyltransferase [Bacteroidetes bacterium]|nr:site-specific DNA-methyltransferase [Bacteroidota bacterium]MBU1680145.1 site-specific DNA-methyltransferase [Bacteroidota bacterium]MBU2507334.1 site-specific DNA-methyltransferase [Bacteroidota bacterium]
MPYYNISLSQIRKNVEKRKKKYVDDDSFIFDKNEYSIGIIKEVKNNFGETLTRVDGNIPVSLPIETSQRFLFISYDQTRGSHGLHKYPAKFFPELPRWLLQKYSKPSNIILDPFMGSGTSNIEAMLLGRHSVGIDVDPFAKFLTKVKTTKLDVDELEESTDLLLNTLVKYDPKKINKKDIPIFPYRDNWFDQEILFELSYIKQLIVDSKYSNDIKDFQLISLSSIIRSVSNADNNCTRTVVRKKLNKNVYPSMALTKFAETLLLNSYRITEFSTIVNTDISVEIPDDNDARSIKYPANYFDFALTSPPYANAVDYPRTHQLEMYWLGLANGSLTPMKKEHVGTESVSVDDYKLLHKIGVVEADKIIESIYKVDPRRAFIAYKYLIDMEENLREVQRVLKKKGKYVIVVGNNKIRGFNFESWKYLMSLSERVGLKVNNYFGSEIIKHFIKVPRDERINTDWIIVLEK